MDTYFPPLLIAYLKDLCQALSKPNRVYLQSFIWALLLVEGKKCVTRIAEACFFIDKSLSSFERFLSEYHWDLNEVIVSLVQLLLNELGDKFKIYGAYLLAADTILIAKASKKMAGVQKWKEHSSNPDRLGYQIAHNWAVIALISHFYRKYISWPILCRLVSGKKNPCEYVATEEGIRPADISKYSNCLDLSDGILAWRNTHPGWTSNKGSLGCLLLQGSFPESHDKSRSRCYLPLKK